jgi:hypothetical protein
MLCMQGAKEVTLTKIYLAIFYVHAPKPPAEGQLERYKTRLLAALEAGDREQRRLPCVVRGVFIRGRAAELAIEPIEGVVIVMIAWYTEERAPSLIEYLAGALEIVKRPAKRTLESVGQGGIVGYVITGVAPDEEKLSARQPYMGIRSCIQAHG